MGTLVMSLEPKVSHPHLVMGIDPGLSGAISVLDASDPKNLKIVDVLDMPTFDINSKRQLNLMDISNQIERYAIQTRLALFEEVFVMTGKESRGSMFNFGRAFGQVEGILSSFAIPLRYTKPAVWKSVLGLGRDKDQSRQMVTRMFPADSERFKRKKDDGRAEAVLLAVLAARF
jgi:Holliday junction resolvasome RuvABC endonuclease subunit